MDLSTELGVVACWRAGVETPFFSAWESVLTWKVNIKILLIGGSSLSKKVQGALVAVMHTPELQAKLQDAQVFQNITCPFYHTHDSCVYGACMLPNLFL